MTEFFGNWNGTNDDADEIEETVETITTTTTRTSRKKSMAPDTSSTTKTTTMTTPAKLYGRELSAYDEVDVDELLAKLSQEELTMLAKEVDPDDDCLPPSLRNNYACEKGPTGPLNRKKLIEHINKQALETPDRPEVKPYVAGVVRGKKWIPPPVPDKVRDAEEQITIDLGDEYETALTTATQEEIIDLAAILGFHSMMNQDQYHASLLNKGQPIGLGWDGITKATKPKIYPMDPPNDADPEQSINRVKDNDQAFLDLNLNNIKNISDEKFEKLFEALKTNTHLEVLSLVNVGLNDRTAQLLADALEANRSLRVVNVETNFISPAGVVQLVKALLTTNTVEEFRASNQETDGFQRIAQLLTDALEANRSLRVVNVETNFISPAGVVQLVKALLTSNAVEVYRASNQGTDGFQHTGQMLADVLEANRSLRVVYVGTNFISLAGVVQLVKTLLTTNTVEDFRAYQRSQVLGNKIEMEITRLVEQNPTLLRLGLHLEYSDARHRVASHLQRNIDRNCRIQKRATTSLSLRLPRGRPPAVGVDSSFFNLTPPSAEPTTPTNERRITDKPITDDESDVPNGTDRFVRAAPPDIHPEPHATPATPEPQRRLDH